MLHTIPADAMDVEHTSAASHASAADSSLARLRRFSSPATSNPASSIPTTFPATPSRDEERDFILNVMSERLRPHQTCFIISMGWWNAWKAYVGLAEDPSQAPTVSSPRPGPINNLPLCPNKGCPTLMELCALRVLAMQKKNKAEEEGASCTAEPQLNLDVEEYLDNFDKTLLRRALCRSREMKPGLVEGKDCVAVPTLAWKAFHSWYGGGPVIPRPVIGVGLRQRLQVELYPVTLLVVPVNSGRSADKETHRFTFSPHDQVKTVRRTVCGRFLIPPHKVDLFWHLPGAEAEHLSNLEVTLGHVGLNDGCLVSLQRVAHFHPLATPAATAPQTYPVPTPQLPQNADDNARPLASPAQPL